MKNIKYLLKRNMSAFTGNKENISSKKEYTPYVPGSIDLEKFLKQIDLFFALGHAQTRELWDDYLRFYNEKQYSTMLGERKTRSMEEAFVLYVVF